MASSNNGATRTEYTTVIVIYVPTLAYACLAATFLLYLVFRIVILCHRRNQNEGFDLEQGDSSGGDGGEQNTQEERQAMLRQEAMEKLLPRTRNQDVRISSSSSSSSGDCVICLEEFENGEPIRGFPGCNHVFHLTCMYQWLKNKITCPLCRKSLLNTREGRRVYYRLFS